MKMMIEKRRKQFDSWKAYQVQLHHERAENILAAVLMLAAFLFVAVLAKP